MARSEPNENTPYLSDEEFEIIDTEPNTQKLLNLILNELPRIAERAQSELNEILQDITKTTNSDKSENKQLKVDIRQLRNENKQLKSEKRQLQIQMGELEEQKSETEAKCQDELYELQQTINNMEKEIDKLNSTTAVLEDGKTNAKLSKHGDIDDAAKRKIQSYDTIALILKQTQAKRKETEAELDATKPRLSKSMGDKLTDNNPNIADLSDENRPTKLAEKFQELYDNQWTDAFEMVEKKSKAEEIEDTETTSRLIKILMETKTFCEDESSYQTKEMQRAIVVHLSDRDIPAEVNKQIKDCRRNVATFSGKQIFQKYQEKLIQSDSSTARMAKRVPNFVKECFNICWLMTVQDPPLVFGPDISKGERFDTDMYKTYTKSGRKIDFVVWPALLLHKNGPVLTKGVAQGLVEYRNENSGTAHGRSEQSSAK